MPTQTKPDRRPLGSFHRKTLAGICWYLGTVPGCLLVMLVLLIVFLTLERCGQIWAGQAILPTLSVLLVVLNNPIVATHGVRITGLAVTTATGIIGVIIHAQSAEQVVHSSLAVLLVTVVERLYRKVP